MLGFNPIASAPLASIGKNELVYLEGLEAAASVGEVTVVPGTGLVVNLNGLSATGFVGTLIVWEAIIPDSGVTYTEITPSSSASFTEITPSAGTSYTEVAPSPGTSYTEITPSSSAVWKEVAA